MVQIAKHKTELKKLCILNRKWNKTKKQRVKLAKEGDKTESRRFFQKEIRLFALASRLKKRVLESESQKLFLMF